MQATSQAAAASPPDEDGDECPICKDKLVRRVALPCGHQYCADCLLRSVSQFGHRCCPTCRGELYTGQTVQAFTNFNGGGRSRSLGGGFGGSFVGGFAGGFASMHHPGSVQLSLPYGSSFGSSRASPRSSLSEEHLSQVISPTIGLADATSSRRGGSRFLGVMQDRSSFSSDGSFTLMQRFATIDDGDATSLSEDVPLRDAETRHEVDGKRRSSFLLDMMPGWLFRLNDCCQPAKRLFPQQCSVSIASP